MKKTCLFYSAVFCSFIASAQTTVQSQQAAAAAAKVENQATVTRTQTSGSTSASATVPTETALKAKTKSKAALENSKDIIVTKKEEAGSAGEAGIAKAKKIADKEVQVKASAAAGADVNAGPSQVKVNSGGDVNSGTTVSLNKVKENTVAVKKETAASIEKNTNAAVQKTTTITTAAGTAVSGAAKTTTAVAAGSGTKVAGAVKAKPTRVGVKTRTATTAGIKLR